MVSYGRRQARMGPMGRLIAVLGVLLAPLATIFLIDVMFGVAIPYTLTTYVLIFVVYLVVLFIIGSFIIAGRKLG